VLAAMIEYADLAVVVDQAAPAGLGLVRTLARPDATVLTDASAIDSAAVVSGHLHRHDVTSAWVAADRRGPVPPAADPGVWRVDLRSDRPFHPDRLLEDIERLGTGRHRSRGCFWLPSRPGRACVWDGAGGQLSIGTSDTWRQGPPHTRIVLAGVGPEPDHLRAAFESLLVTPAEIRQRGQVWEVGEDGLEPWLGPVRRVA
jgi:G3E family GTPase